MAITQSLFGEAFATGGGTVGRVAERLGRDWIGIDLNPAYSAIQKKRTAQAAMVLI